MRDLLTQDGKPESDLSKRMADNVVQAMVGYMQAPSAITAETVHAYSTALSSLSLLAIAEQLQAMTEHLAVSVYGADAVMAAADAPDPNECTECAGTGLAVYGGDNEVIDCPVCHGRGRL